MWIYRKKTRFFVTYLLVAWVILSSCLSSQPGERTAIPTTLNSVLVTPDITHSVVAIPVAQTDTSTIQAELLVSPSLFSSPSVSSIPENPPTVTATTTPIEPIPPGWIAFGDNIFGSIDIIQTNGIGRRSIVESVIQPGQPVWSPDGQWIAFLGSSYNYGRQIYLVRPDGSELKQLTFSHEYKNTFSWSPDGQSIVYSQVTNAGKDPELSEVDLFIYEIDPPRIRQLTDTPGVYEHTPAYSPSGDAIAFTSVGKDDQPHIFQLMVMNLDGTNAKQILETPINVYAFAWSPDGKQIVFISSETETDFYACDDLYLVNLDGGDPKRLTTSHECNASLSWSPNGEWITFSRASCNYPAPPGRGDIYVIHSSGGGLTRLSNTHRTVSPAWSPWPALQADKTFTITELGANLSLRSTHSLSGETLAWLNRGEHIVVLDGPEEADEYLWWYVRVVESGKEGWVADNPGWYEAE